MQNVDRGYIFGRADDFSITRYSSDDPSFPKSCDNLASFDEQLMITYIGDLQVAA